MNITNSNKNYGIIAIFLHWVMAIFIFILIGLGLYMVSLPEVGFSTLKVRLIFIHKELGMWVFFLAIVRTLWRLGNKIPSLPEEMSVLQKFFAHSMHQILYLYLFALPLTGWIMSSAGQFPVFFFGFKLPDIVAYNYNNFILYLSLHKYLAYSLIALLILHIGAALFHYFYYKDKILQRMLSTKLEHY